MAKKFEIPNSPLKHGDKGLDVFRLQKILDSYFKLKSKNKTSVIEPSRYMGYTQMLVSEFQKAHGLRISGIYDTTTRAKLREVLNGNSDKDV